MTIYGVALLALCTLLGAYFGDALGVALGVKANVGGVGIAMVLLVTARFFLSRKGATPEGVTLGVGFWSKMYIPIVVAMAANQNVIAALKGGPMVAIAAIVTAVACFLAVPLLAAIGRPKSKPQAGEAS